MNTIYTVEHGFSWNPLTFWIPNSNTRNGNGSEDAIFKEIFFQES